MRLKPETISTGFPCLNNWFFIITHYYVHHPGTEVVYVLSLNLLLSYLLEVSNCIISQKIVQIAWINFKKTLQIQVDNMDETSKNRESTLIRTWCNNESDPTLIWMQACFETQLFDSNSTVVSSYPKSSTSASAWYLLEIYNPPWVRLVPGIWGKNAIRSDNNILSFRKSFFQQFQHYCLQIFLEYSPTSPSC